MTVRTTATRTGRWWGQRGSGAGLIVLLAALLVGLAACASGGGVASDASRREAFDTRDYRLGSGDEVRVSVFGEPDLSGQVRVDGRGAVTLPLVGAIDAEALTSAELSEAVALALSEGYLRDPRVTVEVTAYRPYFILGEVTKPGTYPYQDGLTVLNAVATAEGFTYRANERFVFIVRDGEEEERRFVLDSDTPVRPGDTIRIGERFL